MTKNDVFLLAVQANLFGTTTVLVLAQHNIIQYFFNPSKNYQIKYGFEKLSGEMFPTNTELYTPLNVKEGGVIIFCIKISYQVIIKVMRFVN